MAATVRNFLQKYCRRICKHSCDFMRHSTLEIHSSCHNDQIITPNKKINLWDEYSNLKSAIDGAPLPKNRGPTRVYANNELNLKDIDVYGFDYDYTIACYKHLLHDLIYDLGSQVLVRDLRYPPELQHLEYNPGFAIRGLHCDVKRGLLLKIDAFLNIQMGTVYRGIRPVSDDEVRKCYNGTHIGVESMGYYGVSPKMHQLMDLFALPEMMLFANVIEYFIRKDIPYDPEYVFYDIRRAVQSIHASGVLHNAILKDLDSYINHQKEVSELLSKLSSAGKKLFLITNSGPTFVNKGMTFIVGSNWHELFDVIITNARKPKFFTEPSRPFRSYDYKLGVKSWNKVTALKKGQFYQEGNFHKLAKFTGWCGSNVLYFGDHVYTDLADVNLNHGWRTGAIIPELEDEIKTINSTVYKKSLRWLVALEKLIERMQIYEDAESQHIVNEWLKESHELRLITKNVFNPQFGSLFRTYHNPTYFTRRLNRFADVYTSSVVNLLHYSLNHTFYPRRAALPHEIELCTGI